MANEMRCLGCLAVLLAAKGDPSLHERCARCLITHYLTRPGPSSACYDGWIRVTSGMIRRKYSGYRESHRESRQDVICAGFHGNEAGASWFVGRDAGGTLVWVATPLVTSSFTQACIHRTPTYVLTRTQTGFTPHSPNIDIQAIPSTTTHSANAAAIGPDRAATGARSHYHTHHSSHDGRK